MKNKEVFKPVKGFEGIYEVSDLGTIRSLNRYCRVGVGKTRRVRQRILKTSKDSKGYLKAHLYLNGKAYTRRVHQLVAEAFLNYIPSLKRFLVVDHVNKDKTDNRLQNLQVITQRQNATKDRANENGFTGVSRNRNGYMAMIYHEKKAKYLGTFKTAKEAYDCYDKEATLLDSIQYAEYFFKSKELNQQQQQPITNNQ